MNEGVRARVEAALRAWPDVAARLRAGGRWVLTTHRGPDVDGVASALALAHSRALAGHAARVALCDALPARLGFLRAYGQVATCADDAALQQLVGTSDLVVVVDAPPHAAARLVKAARHAGVPTTCIDHHLTPRATSGIVVPSSPSCGQVVWHLLDVLGLPVDAKVAHLLYLSVAADTASFRHLGPEPADTLRLAAHLVALGACPDRAVDELYGHESPDGMRLVAEAARRLQWHHEGRLVLVQLDPAALAPLHVDRQDFRRLAAWLVALEGVRVAVIVVEHPSGRVQVSLRARPGVCVEPIARALGGGGHAQACGATVGHRSAADVATEVVERVGTLLGSP